MHWWYGDAWWGLVIMTIAMAVFWALVAWAVVALLRASSTPSRPESSRTTSAEAILAERFASGEIEESEYRTRLDALRSTGTHSR